MESATTTEPPGNTATTKSGQRKVYLVVQRQPLFKAHWAIFVPSTQDATVGAKIHATGDALNGFEVAFDRNYTLETGSPSQSTTLLGAVNSASQDTEDAQDAVDKLEAYAASVPAPGPSLRSSSSSGTKVSLPAKLPYQ